MILKSVFSLLLLLIPLTSGGIMKDSTCDTIIKQLRLIDGTINDAARAIQSTPSKALTVDERFTQLLISYHTIMDDRKRYEEQVSTFVQGKLKQFSIPVDGLEENTSLLEKIFSAVEDRNAFLQLQVVEQKLSNNNLNTEIENNQREITALKERQQELQSLLITLNNSLTMEEHTNRKLQAKINDNPAIVQG